MKIHLAFQMLHQSNMLESLQNNILLLMDIMQHTILIQISFGSKEVEGRHLDMLTLEEDII